MDKKEKETTTQSSEAAAVEAVKAPIAPAPVIEIKKEN
jgi:hypothetical protein